MRKKKGRNDRYLERLFARVLSNMSSKDARGSECLVAVDALVRPLAAVHTHVLVE